MKVELTIDRMKELPKGAVPALEKELLKRLNDHYDNCRLTIRRAGADGLSVFGGDKDDKRKLNQSSRIPGKALTTGFIRIALKAGAHFSEYRNLRNPLMLLPTIFNRVC